MKSKLIYPMVFLLGTIACGGRNGARGAAQQNYETVDEGSASGVASTIQGPGETLPPVTGTNADTTTNFALNPNAAPLPTMQPQPLPPPMTSASSVPIPQPAAPALLPASQPEAQQPRAEPGPDADTMAPPATTTTVEPQEQPKEEEPPPPADDTSGEAEEPPPPPPA